METMVLFFCQHCGMFRAFDIHNPYDDKHIENFAQDKCEFSPTGTHILSAVVLPDEKK